MLPYFLGSFGGAFLAYILLHFVVTGDFYKYKNEQEQIKWRYLIVSLLAHLITPTWVFLNLKNNCPEKGDYAWYTDQECFFRLNPEFALYTAAYCGFELWDLCIVAFFLRNKNGDRDLMLVAHHVFNILGNTMAFYGGFASLACAMLGTGIDFTSIFLNIKDLVPESYKNGKLDLINKLTFFFSFTIVRILGIPLICLRTTFDMYGAYE